MRERSGVDAASLPGAEERSLLRDSLRGFLVEHWPADQAVGRGREPEAIARVWSQLVDQGLAGLGGEPLEGGLRELAVAMEELGRGACPAPLLGAGLANLALAGAEAASAKELLAQLHAGRARLCWSFGELDPSAGAAQLTWSGDVLSGTLRFVDAAEAATHLVVARSGGRPGLAVVALGGHDASRMVSTRALGADGWAEILLAN
ncbi:MAG: acyl-CoA dehydrogenase family protein, partial [Caldimonas sp.]